MITDFHSQDYFDNFFLNEASIKPTKEIVPLDDLASLKLLDKKEYRRRVHVRSENKRRTQINQANMALRQILGLDHKLSRDQVLENAAMYIQNIVQEIAISSIDKLAPFPIVIITGAACLYCVEYLANIAFYDPHCSLRGDSRGNYGKLSMAEIDIAAEQVALTRQGGYESV
ncbi:hypothetical protein O9G_001734 [Rozella allomycis CSF55]|uniref:BHLH domain-containing protein n=1 Tax=Rozella allomycis (strain CSF55) TaxID=988480 RepID=A0A075AX70_ROZAC|nr:hypothetical protein O9G_001734 [Rozella allomycis CSF55]|eukprot:EPZ33322.1 hypothetical protein O9G_001734 [Rozella allomycis CSF55]